MEVRNLENTPFEFLYTITFAPNDVWLEFVINVIIFINIASIILWGMVEPLTYGKLKPSTNKSGSWDIWNTPIKSKFHWRFGLCGTLVVSGLLITFTPCRQLFHWPNFPAFIIYFVHFFNRVIIYPSRISDKAADVPLSIFLTFLLYFITDPILQANHILNLLQPQPVSIISIAGVILAFLGLWINVYHDNVLVGLAAQNKGYQIPTSGLFKYVSCANYFGEILEWWGLALVTGALPQILYAILTTVALVPRSRVYHIYYKERFGSKYPKERKAVIPFLY